MGAADSDVLAGNTRPLAPIKGYFAMNACIKTLYVIWWWTLLKDFLYSAISTYPYFEYLTTAVGIGLGWLVLRNWRRMVGWQMHLAIAGDLLLLGDLSGISPVDPGLRPALPILLCSLGLSTLWIQRHTLASKQREISILTLLLGSGTLCCAYSSTTGLTTWGAVVMLASLCSTGILALAVSPPGRLLPAQKNPIARSVVIITLLLAWGLQWIVVAPAHPISLSDETLWGTGMEHLAAMLPVDGLTLPALHGGGVLFVRQYGLLSLAPFEIMVSSLLVLAGYVFLQRSEDSISSRVAERHSLCCAVVGTLMGLTFSALATPTFLSASSICGTWALVVVILGIACSADPLEQSSLHNTHVFPKKMALKMVRLGVGPATLLVLSLCLFWSYQIRPRVAALPLLTSHSDFVRIAAISQPMQDATVAMEDANFFEHHGFNFASIHNALRYNIYVGRVKAGGSTITQQLAKNLFLSNRRTLDRKLMEAAYTVEMERVLPKSCIMEIYLNTIDYGMGQHGVRAAAHYYFQKSPSELNLAESAFLVGMVPHPPIRREEIPQLAERRQSALFRMGGRWPDRYTTEERKQAADVPLERLLASCRYN